MVSRALVLIGCLAAAGAVAAYSKQSDEPSEQAQVFTVRAPSPGPAAPPGPTRVAIDSPADRATLIRDLQRELKRVGCYSGDVNGVWTTSSRMAMKSFTDKVNASLPIDNPDDILLSLVRGHQDTACAGSCPSGRVGNEHGHCLVAAKAAEPPKSEPLKSAPATPEPVTEPKATSSAAPVAIAAAVAGSAVIAKSAPDTAAVPKRARADTAPVDREVPPRNAERPRRYSGVEPPERVYKRRSRRYSNSSRPPKFVRNVMRAFGIR